MLPLLVVQRHEVLNEEAQSSYGAGGDLLLVAGLERGVFDAGADESLHFARLQVRCFLRIDDDLLNRIETADETQGP